jgi:hypothetical protein
MAKRKAKPKRSKKSAFNLTNAAQTLIIANGVSQGLFNTNLATFTGLSSDFSGGGNMDGSNNSDELTAKEIISGITGWTIGGRGTGIYTAGTSSWSGSIGQVVAANAKNNMFGLIGTVVFVPIAFKLGKKVLGKPIINPLNRALKAVGVAKDVKV